MVNVKLPDGSLKEVPGGSSAADVAASIGPGLAKAAIAARINGGLVDLAARVTDGCEISIITTKDADALEVMRHTAAHIMAQAICAIWPQTKLVYGPTVNDGFFYDIDLDTPIKPEDFEKIESRMAEVVKADAPIIRHEMSRQEAMQRVAGDPYKRDNIARAEGDTISFYSHGNDFEDLCRGPHLPSTGRLGAFKIMSVAGAYWHGDASQKMLQRVYGTAWPTKKELDEYLFRLEEAKRRDHRILGRQLDLFSIQDDIGPGLILWHPKGSLIRHMIESFWREEHLKRGYSIIYSPHIATENTYKRSGHLDKYADMMYSPMDIDGQNYYLKPMNCPGHYMIYNNLPRTYRELPMRFCELGMVYRYEPSGTLHGMLRVRGFTQDDAHTFCTPEHLGTELDLILELMHFMMTTFGYTYKAYLATRPAKYLGTEEEWERATSELRMAMERRGLPYEVDEGGGVFYAPKIDIKLIDSLGREWQGPTHQVDLQAAKRFDIRYVGPDNALHEPVIIHRTVLGSMERFIGGLIEHYGGNMPLWLAPEHARILPISEKTNDYAMKLQERLKTEGLRVGIDATPEKIGAKIARTYPEKLPYMLVVGPKEAEADEVNIRIRGQEHARNLKVGAFVDIARRKIADRQIDVAF
ncbi:MAG TPA: threonine--tRNA ligase [Sedimentisphaerales bacterium]|nr:threonine--tRNA ligase [Sedimentisphaerales bacterium]